MSLPAVSKLDPNAASCDKHIEMLTLSACYLKFDTYSKMKKSCHVTLMQNKVR